MYLLSFYPLLISLEEKIKYEQINRKNIEIEWKKDFYKENYENLYNKGIFQKYFVEEEYFDETNMKARKEYIFNLEYKKDINYIFIDNKLNTPFERNKNYIYYNENSYKNGNEKIFNIFKEINKL